MDNNFMERGDEEMAVDLDEEMDVDLYDDEDLFQEAAGQDHPVEEDKLVFGKSINILEILQSRVVGEKISVRVQKTTLLSFSLMHHMASAPRKEVFQIAGILLKRRLYRWEGRVLDFFKTWAVELDAELTCPARKEMLPSLLSGTEAFKPITFSDIIDVLLKTGAQLNAKNASGRGLLIDFLEHNELHEDSANFFEYLRDCGLNLEDDGEVAVRLLCESLGGGPITNAKLRILVMIFDVGVELSEAARRDSISKFTRGILSTANQLALRILELLFDHGCQPNQALLNMDNFDRRFTSRNHADHFDLVLHIATILLQHGALVNGDISRPNFIFQMLDCAWGEIVRSSMLPFLTSCLGRGLNVDVIEPQTQQNLLLAFSFMYSFGDLPQVIRLLCNAGVAVNAVSQDGNNALYYLAKNELASSQAILGAVLVLIEYHIDVTYENADQYTVAHEFILPEAQSPCCFYFGLRSLNETTYWEIINSLLDAGMDLGLDQTSDYTPLSCILDRLIKLKANEATICRACLMSDSGPATRGVAIAELETVHFENALRCIERMVEAGALDHPYPGIYISPMECVQDNFEGEHLLALMRLFIREEDGNEPLRMREDLN